MRRARSLVLADKSLDAALAAIEVYNKPDFRYREESFAILMLNAWELLLKARILKEHNNDMRSIEVWQKRRRVDGTLTERAFAKKNRSGNNMTIEVRRA